MTKAKQPRKLPVTHSIKQVRYLDGIPVEDAADNLVVVALKQDFKKAQTGAPEFCVYANAIRRLTHSPRVLVYKTIAYVLHTKGEGAEQTQFWRRYRLGHAAQVEVQEFDRLQPVALKAVTFLAPEASQTLDAKEEHRHAVKEGRHIPEPRGPQLLAGTATPAEMQRDGTGRVRFHKLDRTAPKTTPPKTIPLKLLPLKTTKKEND